MKTQYAKHENGNTYYYSDKAKTILHRTDGPAITGPDGYEEWYINGKELTEEEFNARIMKAHQYLYYVLGTPVLSDYEYDMFCRDYALDGKGGSDLESSYSEQDKAVAQMFLNKELT